MNRTRTNLQLLAIFLVALLAGSGCTAASRDTAEAAATPQATVGAPLVVAGQAGNQLASLQGTLETIYRQVNPSVVNIQVTVRQTVTTSPFGILPFPNLPFSSPQGPQEFFSHGSGSGFVWDKEGHIITNNHVVDNAERILVTFADDSSVEAQVVGADPDSDLAVIQVDVPAGKLQPVRLADSTQVMVGELVAAIGNPFGLQGTMTVGFVSALGRLLPVDNGSASGLHYNIPDVIQTDAPINPGNSGGILVDESGRVIGVTSAIISPAGANAGIGFAIPSAIVQKVVPSLIADGSYEHPYLGISIGSLTPDVNEQMALSAGQRGALVSEVTPGSPAEDAGIKGSDRVVTIEGQELRVGGDVILAVDGQPVRQSDDLITYLARHTEVGQTLTLTVLRDGREREIKVTLEARPHSETTTTTAQGAEETPHGARLGVSGVSLTPALAQAMDLPAAQQGVLIQQIVLGSPADKAGLQGSFKPALVGGQRVLVGGDVITAFDGTTVTSVQDLVQALQQANPGQEISLHILRDGSSLDINLTLDAGT